MYEQGVVPKTLCKTVDIIRPKRNAANAIFEQNFAGEGTKTSVYNKY
jgi:hypothetical protein